MGQGNFKRMALKSLILYTFTLKNDQSVKISKFPAKAGVEFKSVVWYFCLSCALLVCICLIIQERGE